MQIFTRLLQVLRQRRLDHVCGGFHRGCGLRHRRAHVFPLCRQPRRVPGPHWPAHQFQRPDSIVASVPIGLPPDLRGRKQVLAGGMLLFKLVGVLHHAPNPWLLIPVRVMGSLGMIAVFMVGVAYMGDVVAKEDRGLAGLYSTAKGLGFTVGPAAGGLLAERYGYRAGFWLAAGVALVGFSRGAVGAGAANVSPPAAHR
ncbi:MAG: MFS transporter [Caldilineaceae bacterium]